MLEKEDIVICESIVYSGVTEEVCAPILEEKSKLKFNTDFYIGYSLKRINPGGKKNAIENVLKVALCSV